MSPSKQAFLDLIHQEVVPALGCTEPIAVALTAAKAAETLGYSWHDRWDETVPRFMAETQRDIAALPLAEDWGEELSRQIQAHERRKEQEP